MVGQTDHRALAQHPLDWILDLGAGFLIDDAEHGGERLAPGLGFQPAGEVLRHRIHMPHSPRVVRGNHRIANAVQRGAKCLLLLSPLPFRLIQFAIKTDLPPPVGAGGCRCGEQ